MSISGAVASAARILEFAAANLLCTFVAASTALQTFQRQRYSLPRLLVVVVKEVGGVWGYARQIGT